MNEQAKQLAFGGAHESVKNVRILAHRQVGEQFHRLARRRKFIIRRKWNNDLVTHAVDLHGDLGRKRFDELALKEGDHGHRSKSQIPNPKSQKTSKLQMPKARLGHQRLISCLGFGIWDLGFLWSLELGALSFCRVISSSV